MLLLVALKTIFATCAVYSIFCVARGLFLFVFRCFNFLESNLLFENLISEMKMRISVVDLQ